MPWDPMGECPCFTVLRQIILEGILLASQCTGKRRAVKHIYFCLLSTNWLPLLRALQLVNGDPSQVDLLYISCPRRRCTPAPARGRARTHTHTHTHTRVLFQTKRRALIGQFQVRYPALTLTNTTWSWGQGIQQGCKPHSILLAREQGVPVIW